MRVPCKDMVMELKLVRTEVDMMVIGLMTFRTDKALLDTLMETFILVALRKEN